MAKSHKSVHIAVKQQQQIIPDMVIVGTKPNVRVQYVLAVQSIIPVEIALQQKPEHMSRSITSVEDVIRNTRYQAHG